MLTFPTQKSQDTTGSRFMQEILVVSRFFVPSQIHNSGKQIDLSGKWNQLNLGSLWSLPDLAGEEWFATELTKSKFCKNMLLSEQNFNFSVLIAYPILNLNSWDRLQAINCWDNNMSSCFSSFKKVVLFAKISLNCSRMSAASLGNQHSDFLNVFLDSS